MSRSKLPYSGYNPRVRICARVFSRVAANFVRSSPYRAPPPPDGTPLLPSDTALPCAHDTARIELFRFISIIIPTYSGASRYAVRARARARCALFRLGLIYPDVSCARALISHVSVTRARPPFSLVFAIGQISLTTTVLSPPFPRSPSPARAYPACLLSFFNCHLCNSFSAALLTGR